MQLQELNNIFIGINMELLFCVVCLNPTNYFSSYDKLKLIRLTYIYRTYIYRKDFIDVELMSLEHQLENYIIDMQSTNEFVKLKLSDL